MLFAYQNSSRVSAKGVCGRQRKVPASGRFLRLLGRTKLTIALPCLLTNPLPRACSELRSLRRLQ